jgi:hypothetical protein
MSDDNEKAEGEWAAQQQAAARQDTDTHCPTETLIRAMENADDMAEVMVIFRLKADAAGHAGMGWVTEQSSLHAKLAFMEEAKFAMCNTIYGRKEEEQ